MTQTTHHAAQASGATKPLKSRIAVVFDFDDTLAPDALDGLLKFIGVDADTFRQQHIQPLVEAGWDSVAARCYCLVKESQRRSYGDKITRDTLAQFGQQIEPFPGVENMLEALRQRVQELNPEIDLKLYVITGGFGDIVRNTSIAHYFERIWGCEFAYDDQGEVEFLKRSISHTEKTRYLMQIASGQEIVDSSGQAFAYRDAPQADLHVPLSQMVYVGDGVSDVPCFSLLNDKRGFSIGVTKDYSDAQWGEDIQVSESQRVSNLAAADYQDDSEMLQSLLLAVESICKQIALRQLSVGE